MVNPISTDMLLQQAQQVSQSLNTGSASELAGKIGTPGTGQVDGAGQFNDMLGKLIEDVDQAQKQADVSLKRLAAGENESIQDVVMKMEEADVSFRLMKEIRDKLLNAYKEVMSMSG